MQNPHNRQAPPGMRRAHVFTALLLALAGSSGDIGAVELDPHGLGQVLLYPYFTVNAGNQTLISVVNTRSTGKALKLRFREAYIGRELLGFNLYLSPYDVWTGTIFDTASVNGRANDGSAPAGLLTPDDSCTAPAIKASNPSQPALTEALPDGRRFVPFFNFGYSGAHADSAPADLARTRTGHLELIEMATLSGTTLAATMPDNLTGVPANCIALLAAAPGADYHTPDGGLFGTASIVNVNAGTLYGYNAEALNGFYTAAGNLYSSVGSPLPDLGSGDNGNVSTGNAVSHVFSANGGLISSSWPLAEHGSLDAVSSVLAADELINEYEINPQSGSVASEWVVTFPTKGYYVDPASAEAPLPPFSAGFGGDPSRPGSACEPVMFASHDRSGQLINGLAPPPPATPPTCWEAQVLTFPGHADGSASPSRLFGSPLVGSVYPFGGTSGTISLRFANGHSLRRSIEGNVFSGLPAIGFLAKDFTNNNVTPGVLGNYAGTFRHHITQTCGNDARGSCETQ